MNRDKHLAVMSKFGFWEDFISVYYALPCLWDANSTDYNDKQSRTGAYDVLVSKCKEMYPDANRDFVAKKIHNFRCGFRREWNKVQEAKMCGRIYVPSLWYFELMKFITGSETSELPNIYSEDDSLNWMDNKGEVDGLVQNDVQDDANTNYSAPSGSNSPTPVPKRRRRQTRESNATMMELTDLAHKALSRPVQEDDECDVAGKKLAFDLRKMSERQRTIAEKIISDVIFHGKLDQLNETCSFTVRPLQVPASTTTSLEMLR